MRTWIFNINVILPNPNNLLGNSNNVIANKRFKCVLNEVNELKLALDAFHISRSTRTTRGKQQNIDPNLSIGCS